MTMARKNRRNRNARAALAETKSNNVVTLADAQRAASYVPKVLKETIDESVFDGVTDCERELLAILSTCRKANGQAEKYVIAEYLDSIAGMQSDSYGNRFIRVGAPHYPIAFSSHTDSVHYMDGVQQIAFDGREITLAKTSKANCLGADCGVGVWLMRQMILANIPGLYLFHRDEESGMQGSQWIVENTPALLDGVKAIIAFDRRGFDSIITHQMCERTASDVFGETLAHELNQSMPFPLYELDTGGSYTDSYAYRRMIPECTNIGVGYLGQHGKHESQCMRHALQLLDAMKSIDYGALIFDRDETEIEYDGFGFNGRAYGRTYSSNGISYADTVPPYSDGYGDSRETLMEESTHRVPTMENMIRDNVAEIADLLRDYGFDEIELHDAVMKRREMFFGSH